MARAFTIGVDFGTNSVRAVVVDCADGRVRRHARVRLSQSGERGVLLDPRRAAPRAAESRRLPRRAARVGARARSPRRTRDPGFSRERVIGIGVDTTGSTPLPVDAACRPLALRPAVAGATSRRRRGSGRTTPAAAEAAAITETARAHAPAVPRADRRHVLVRVVLVEDLALPQGRARRVRCGGELGRAGRLRPGGAGGRRPTRGRSVRCVCAAGHKAMYSDAWGGLPSKAFLARLDPRLAELRDRLYDKAYAADRPAGPSVRRVGGGARAAARASPIAMGGFDAHYGAVGAGVRTGTLVKIIGTSTCDCAIAPAGATASPTSPASAASSTARSCPGYFGIEAGQSAVGDILQWWVEVVCEGDERAARAALGGGGARSRPASRGSSRSTGTTATAPSSWTRG